MTIGALISRGCDFRQATACRARGPLTCRGGETDDGTGDARGPVGHVRIHHQGRDQPHRHDARHNSDHPHGDPCHPRNSHREHAAQVCRPRGACAVVWQGAVGLGWVAGARYQ